MYSMVLRLSCKDPKILQKSLKPDIKNDKYSQTEIKAGKDFIEISVKSEKINHLKAIINSYISLVDMFERAEVE